MNLKRFLPLFLWPLPFQLAASDAVWFNGKDAVGYEVCQQHDKVVDVALDMFAGDMQAVTGMRASSHGNKRIQIYQLDRLDNKEFKQLAAYGIPISQFITKKDAFYVCARKGKVVVVGSNGRGTAYGILELSRLAGVSPWIWWGDVKPQHKSVLVMKEGWKTMQSPSVEYRGIFLNDEDWSLRPWSHQTEDRTLPDGTIGPRTYKKVFELLLRLRANTIWPAMHPGTAPFWTVKGNKEVADSCGIIIGSSHCEPLLRNNVGEWDKKHHGEWNYAHNHKHMQQYWEQRLKEAVGQECIYTLGLRGIHDGPIEGARNDDDARDLLQKAIHDQIRLLHKAASKDKALKKREKGGERIEFPTVFIPYKEVLGLYEKGLQVPNEVTLMWSDDNYGYMTRLSNSREQTRKGGSGIYYHLSYWGRPHDYLWLSTQQPGLVWSQLAEAWRHGARKMWIVNVHDPKVAAYQLSLFLDMAWDAGCVRANTVEKHLQGWLAQQFGDVVGQRLLPVMREFYHLTAIRKPEFMGWSQVELYGKYDRGLSPVANSDFSFDDFGNELERYLASYLDLGEKARRVGQLVDPGLQDAYFAAVLYPIEAAANMAVKQLCAQEARTIARPGTFHHDEDALAAAAMSLDAYDNIKRLTNRYNALADGKWKGIMSDHPRDLPVFGEPSIPDPMTPEERKKYGHQMELDSKIRLEDAVAMNAAEYQTASAEAFPIQMLGHSMKAISLPKDGELTYTFYTKENNDALLYLAFVPTQPTDGGDLRVSVAFDDDKPQVISLKEPFRSEGWKQNVLRGQALKTLPLHLSGFSARHRLTIRALDEGIIFDQWMLDFDTNRKFYMIPK